MIREDTRTAVDEVRAVAPTRIPTHRTGPIGYEPVMCDL